jgi:hypothetical protein
MLITFIKELFATNAPDGALRAAIALTISGVRFSDVVKQVDVFYSDSANIRVPIVEAYSYSIMKMKAAENSELERVVTKLRRPTIRSRSICNDANRNQTASLGLESF